MSEIVSLETNQEERVEGKNKKRRWGKIIGIGFWPIVLLIVGIILLVTKDNVFVNFLNPTSDVVFVNFYNYDEGQQSEEFEYKIEVAPNSDTSKSVKKGTYSIEITTKDNQLIRMIDNYTVEEDSKKLTYLDVSGDNIYAAFDASYLYEGNESTVDDYFEYFDSQQPFQVIDSGDDYHITQFDDLPDELEDDYKLYMLIPIPRADITEDTDDEAMNEILNYYIDQKLSKTIENSDELGTIIDKKLNKE